MDTTSLPALVDELTAAAQEAAAQEGLSGRAGRTIHGGHDHPLRQTVTALLAGHELSEHETPAEASLQVLRGRVRLVAGSDSWDLAAGDYLVIPSRRHWLVADEDSAILLTFSLR